jgi:hypothetical protein
MVRAAAGHYARRMAGSDQRAADADRELTAERLREAAGDGRLEHDELEERLEAAYSARTYGELAKLTADLPEAGAEPAGRPPLWQSEELRARLATFIVANVVCVSVWLVTGSEGDFWPKWVLLGTGIALFVTLVHSILGVEEERDDGRPGPLPPGPPGLPR